MLLFEYDKNAHSVRDISTCCVFDLKIETKIKHHWTLKLMFTHCEWVCTYVHVCV